MVNISCLGIVGGSGLLALDVIKRQHTHLVETKYGKPSAPIIEGELAGQPVFFLPRHGATHSVPPHKINYRANIQAFADLGVEKIIGVAAVGGIDLSAKPQKILFPDQIIDYSWGRESTFFDGLDGHVEHNDFTLPYDMSLREQLINSARQCKINVIEQGVYGVTQGPRLETKAEILRMGRDGCTMVGMTAMPEAILAREKGIGYVTCAVVANYAAGVGSDVEITMDEILANLNGGLKDCIKIIATFCGSQQKD
jgi:5'-methylthioinosine phosphorylase